MSLPPLPKNTELEKALGCSVVHLEDALYYGQQCREAALEEAAEYLESRRYFGLAEKIRSMK